MGMDPGRDPQIVRKMAQLMAQGAVMLAETCPLDGLPLFRLKDGSIVCPKHGRVVIVSSEAEAREVEVDEVIKGIIYHAAMKAREELNAESPEGVRAWLDVLEAAERIRSLRSNMQRREREEPGKGKEKK